MFGTERKKKFPTAARISSTLVVSASLLVCFIIMTTQPSCTHYPPTEKTVSTERLMTHVEKLSVDFAPRNYKRITNLDKCAVYISDHFEQAGGRVEAQTYDIKGKTYRNVIAHFGPETDSRIVVGAHYDSCQETPGADDNASGVAGLIELAYLLGKTELKQQVELVAYTLEEPPFFGGPDMGSARHAYSLKKAGVDVEAMICLEMIGYFSDEKGSQTFPSVFVKMLYPDTGNYITVIGSMGDRKLAKKMKTSMRSATDLPVYSMCAPEGFPGLDFSDHRNYWAFDYTAVMITDTAFMRNPHYHGDGDTMDKLDFDRMAKVVLGVYEGVVRLAND